MSRSYKRTPISGHTRCCSDKSWKKMYHSKMRAVEKRLLKHYSRKTVFPVVKEITDIWESGKDGKYYSDHTMSELRKALDYLKSHADMLDKYCYLETFYQTKSRRNFNLGKRRRLWDEVREMPFSAMLLADHLIKSHAIYEPFSETLSNLSADKTEKILRYVLKKENYLLK